MQLVVVFFLLTLALNVESHKILVYNPKLGHSQVIFMGEIADILSEAGHDVLNYVPTVINSCKGTGSKLARVLKRPATHNTTFKLNEMKAWLFDHQSYNGAIDMFSSLGEEFGLSCKEQLADETLIKTLKDEQFEIGLSEYFDICGLALFHKIGLKKWILVYSNPMPLADMSIFGLSSTPSFTPSVTIGYTTEKMSIRERFFNLFNYFIYKYYIRESFVGKTAEAFDSDMPHYLDLMAQSQYVFINVDEYMDFPRPISNKLVNIGGLSMKKLENSKRQLDSKIQKAFETAKDGVVLVSFGSVANSYGAPKEIKEAFLTAFDAFPDITFIWKYEKPEHKINDGHPNVITSTWVDQPSILSHPRLLAFMTHGGLNSVTQATYAGVPMLCIPLFADQTRNAAMIESRGFGIKLDKFKLDSQTVINAIKEVVYNKKYSKNANELSRLIKSKPLSPEERIVKYTEHAATFNVHQYLDFYGRQLSFIEYYNLDIGLLFLLFVVSIVCGAGLLLKRLLLTPRSIVKQKSQ